MNAPRPPYPIPWRVIVPFTPKDQTQIGTDYGPHGDVIFAEATEDAAHFIIHAVNNHAALVEAAKLLHDALSNILEGCNSPDRHMDGITGGEMYSWIHRDQRALALKAIRKSFRVLPKIPGGME